MIEWQWYRWLCTYLLAEENPGKPQLGDRQMKIVRPIIITNGLPIPLNEVDSIAQHFRVGEGMKGWDSVELVSTRFPGISLLLVYNSYFLLLFCVFYLIVFVNTVMTLCKCLFFSFKSDTIRLEFGDIFMSDMETIMLCWIPAREIQLDGLSKQFSHLVCLLLPMLAGSKTKHHYSYMRGLCWNLASESLH